MEFQSMSNEEMQRAIQFLLDHHARMAAHFEQMAATQQEHAHNLRELDRKTNLMSDGLVGLIAIVGDLSRRQLEGFDELRKAGEATDARLNIVVNMFERHLREDHGQRPS